jgi:hypothetical protein
VLLGQIGRRHSGELSLSVKTISTYRARLLEKMVMEPPPSSSSTQSATSCRNVGHRPTSRPWRRHRQELQYRHSRSWHA